MNLHLSGHHLEVTPAIRDYLTSKLERIKRHFDHVIDVNVILSRERERMTKAHPMLAHHAARIDENTAHLARHVEKALRRHGKNIAEMQYTQKRTAVVAIDLYAFAGCLSRTSRAIDRRGEEGARREIDLTTVFVASAEKRIAANIASFDDNDDELRKVIANKTCADGGYPLDVI